MGETKASNRRGGRLKGVRKRKRSKQTYACEVMAYKMHLVKKRTDEREE